MSDLDDFKATYFDECSELLTELEEQFAAIEAGDRAAPRLNAVFRAIHSIKGGAGAFGFGELVGFAHAYETLLDQVREGHVELGDDVVALCIRANDIVADHVAAARDGVPVPEGHGARERSMFDALCGADDSGGPMEEFDIAFTPVRVELHAGEAGYGGEVDRFDAAPLAGELGYWQIDFTPHSTLYAQASDPLLLLRELASLGEAEIEAMVGELPNLADFDPFGVYCSWRVVLCAPQASEAELREVFEFVEGNCDLAITRLESAPLSPVVAPAAVQPGYDRLEAEASDLLSFAELAEAIAPAPAVSTAIAERAGEPEADRRAAMQSIRVDLDKVDRVVNMVGELVIAQSMLSQQMDEVLRARYTELVRGLEVLAQTTRGLQDAVMAIRAQPVKSVFSRMPRLLRELGQKTGKTIRLEMAGENTEIDKTVIEQLGDPLTHMIRNSVDHGIESAEQRLAAGKPETGTIRLSAEQAGGSILIAVEDDGAGINRQKVLSLARQRGLVAPDAQPSDEQIDNLIFTPGFSTADAVSDISGRGVGMDVVISNIQKIGGSVNVKSAPGRGTRMVLRLPLTLAVLDVMLVSVADCPYVIPLSSIVETMQVSRADFGRVPSGGQVLNVRGAYMQVIDLRSRFGMSRIGGGEERFVVLCETEGSAPVALLVDDIAGQQQVVIKSLEENFERIEGIAGGTILGDGSVALIIDVAGLRAPAAHRNAA